MFEMIDALAEGRGKHAASMAHRLMEQQEDVFGLMGMVIRQFRLLLLTKEFLQGGGYPGQIAEALSVHRFTAEKLAKQSRLFDVEKLEQIHRVLHDYDVQIKTGKIDPDLAMDLLIAGLAR
jgi:DNA polymerase-3 subunit delta